MTGKQVALDAGLGAAGLLASIGIWVDFIEGILALFVGAVTLYFLVMRIRAFRREQREKQGGSN